MGDVFTGAERLPRWLVAVGVCVGKPSAHVLVSFLPHDQPCAVRCLRDLFVEDLIALHLSLFFHHRLR